MKLEWDETKRQATLRERGLDFADSTKIFGGPRYVIDDCRKDYGEKRQIMIGTLEGRMVAVVFTSRSDAYRIISMRYANERERHFYATKLDT